MSPAATARHGLLARVLLKGSFRFDAITLRAAAHHRLTDVWTSIGVLVDLGLLKLTGRSIPDPRIVIPVAME